MKIKKAAKLAHRVSVLEAEVDHVKTLIEWCKDNGVPIVPTEHIMGYPVIDDKESPRWLDRDEPDPDEDEDYDEESYYGGQYVAPPIAAPSDADVMTTLNTLIRDMPRLKPKDNTAEVRILELEQERDILQAQLGNRERAAEEARREEDRLESRLVEVLQGRNDALNERDQAIKECAKLSRYCDQLKHAAECDQAALRVAEAQLRAGGRPDAKA